MQKDERGITFTFGFLPPNKENLVGEGILTKERVFVKVII